MKKHFISLFASVNLRKTIILFALAFSLISVSLIIGITDNVPMIGMLFTGIIFLYFATLYPWKKVSYFAILAATCLAILILDFIWPFISEGIAMTTGFVCFAGIITGIIGIFTRMKNWNRIPYTGALFSLVALGILITSVINSLKEVITPGMEWVLIGMQIMIILLLFGIGILNKKDSRLSRVSLIISGIVLILLCIWGFYASTWQFEENAKGFTALMLRIYSMVEIIAASLVLYACK